MRAVHRAPREPRAILAVACLAHLVLAASSIGCAPAALPGEDAGLPTRALGETCSSGDDCESGLCVAIASSRAVCTDVCTTNADCPAGPSWACVQPEELGGRVCGCAASSTTELCGDGFDNECNGRADDCRMCGGRPVPEDDPMNCGTCGNACRADQECAAGVCRCEAGELDCSGACTDVETSTRHCGGCGAPCPALASCVAGECECPSDEPDLCGPSCVDRRSDPLNCGTCGNRCDTGQTCVSGTCSCSNPSFPLHCPGVGCVDRAHDEANCGSCGNVCPPVQSCEAARCECPGTGELCGGACIDTASDPSNCGSCGNACDPGAECRGGDCLCESGLVCGGTCAPIWDETNCGACGRVCRADQSCTGSACACPFSLTDCGTACVDTTRDLSHCGACGNACGPTRTCSSGTCRCAFSGQTYCSAIDACVDLRSSAGHCGACGNACPASQICSSSSCRCPIAGQVYCAASDSCVDTGSDELNCGGCGTICSSATTCQFGSCRCPASGQTYCTSVTACVDTTSDEVHCGRCDNLCPAATSCRSGACACDTAGLSLCGAACVDLQTDATSCGVCGRVCTGGRVCTTGTCQCPAPAPTTLVRWTSTPSKSFEPQLASDGTRVAVVWTERPSSGTTGFSVRFALVEADGTAVPGTESVLSTGTTSGSPDVVWNGSVYGVTWTHVVATERHAMFQRFGADGLAIGAPVNVTDPWAGTVTIDAVRIAWAPVSGFALAINPSSSESYFQLVGADGSGLPLPVLLPIAVFGITTNLDVAGASDGRFAVLYGPNVQLVNADGSITAPNIVVPVGTNAETIGHDGEQFVAAATRQQIVSGATHWQVILLRGPTLGTTHIVSTIPQAMAVYDSVAMTIALGVATVVFTNDTDSSGSRRLSVARARLPTAGAVFAVVAPATLFMSDFSQAIDASPDVTTVGSARIMAAWPDTRWGQYEVYLLPGTVAVCM